MRLVPIRKRNIPPHRTYTSDVTVEQLAALLDDNPRGLVIIRDELSGWIRSMNQYRSGRGADREFYQTVWGNQSYTVDRKNGTQLMLPSPFVGVIGAIPPEVLKDVGSGTSTGDGFLERFLWVWPEQCPVRWNDREVQSTTLSWYEEWIQYLYTLPFNDKPRVLPFTAEAQEFFQVWHDTHMTETEALSNSLFLSGTFGKLKGYCPRLALIHAVCSSDFPSAVGIHSVAAAAGMVDYFKDQARKVDAVIGRGQANPVERVKEAIRRRVSGCRSMKKRDLQRSMKVEGKYFNQALQEMSQPEIHIHRDKDNSEYIHSSLLIADNRQTDKEQP